MNGQQWETTDNAFVQADVTLVSPQVDGYVAEVLVTDNQRVRAGQVLVRLDDSEQKAALAEAEANLAAVIAAVDNVDARVAQEQAIIASRAAAVSEARAQAELTEWGFWQFAGVQAMRGAGVMLAMIAAQQVTMSTLPVHMVKNASGLVNLFRNVGGAVGLALLNTSLTTNTAVHMGELTSAIPASSPSMQTMLVGIAERMSGSIDPDAAALKAVWGMLQRQATTLAFGDAFAALAIGCAACAFVTLLARPVRPAAGAAPVDAH